MKILILVYDFAKLHVFQFSVAKRRCTAHSQRKAYFGILSYHFYVCDVEDIRWRPCLHCQMSCISIICLKVLNRWHICIKGRHHNTQCRNATEKDTGLPNSARPSNFAINKIYQFKPHSSNGCQCLTLSDIGGRSGSFCTFL